jgi:hypothetical protein
MGKDHALVDLTGKQFGNWLVLSRAENMGRNADGSVVALVEAV